MPCQIEIPNARDTCEGSHAVCICHCSQLHAAVVVIEVVYVRTLFISFILSLVTRLSQSINPKAIPDIFRECTGLAATCFRGPPRSVACTSRLRLCCPSHPNATLFYCTFITIYSQYLQSSRDKTSLPLCNIDINSHHYISFKFKQAILSKTYSNNGCMEGCRNKPLRRKRGRADVWGRMIHL